MALQILRTPAELQSWRRTLSPEISVGFVATMGALHAGHAEILKKARAENQVLVLSIFVNPTQFNDKKDLEKYPVTWETDLALATNEKVDVLFAPTFESMYPDHYRYKLVENEFSLKLCGKDRPGHFDGVLSIVMKLLNLVKPSSAYFGEKDYQQFSLIRDMAQAFFIDCDIVPVPTVRELDGLAMSSRNMRLTDTERKWAPKIFQALKSSSTADQAALTLQSEGTREGAQVDYVVDLGGRRFAAVRVGPVRLIDNVEI